MSDGRVRRRSHSVEQPPGGCSTLWDRRRKIPGCRDVAWYEGQQGLHQLQSRGRHGWWKQCLQNIINSFHTYFWTVFCQTARGVSAKWIALILIVINRIIGGPEAPAGMQQRCNIQAAHKLFQRLFLRRVAYTPSAAPSTQSFQAACDSLRQYRIIYWKSLFHGIR